MNTVLLGVLCCLTLLARPTFAANPPLTGLVTLDFAREVYDSRPDGLKLPLSERELALREIRKGNVCLTRLERALRVIESEEEFQDAAALHARKHGALRVELEVKVRITGLRQPWKKQRERAWLEGRLFLRLVRADGSSELGDSIQLGSSLYDYAIDFREWTPAASDWESLIENGGCAVRWDMIFRALGR